MKTSETFKTIIENYLQQTALSVTAFASNFAKTSKSFEHCINYIGSEVKKMGICAFADQDIFDMATKYYNDDTISTPAIITYKALVNQPVKADLFNSTRVATPQVMAQQTPIKQMV